MIRFRAPSTFAIIELFGGILLLAFGMAHGQEGNPVHIVDPNTSGTSSVKAFGRNNSPALDHGSQVEICHCPPGNLANCQTMSVGAGAAEIHLRRHAGDHRGSCDIRGCLGRARLPMRLAPEVTPWPFSEFPIATAPFPPRIFERPQHEPSGLVYAPSANSLYMVDDESYMMPLSLDLVPGDLYEYVPSDPERVTYSPDTDRLYVLSERDRVIGQYQYAPSLQYTDGWWSLDPWLWLASFDEFEGLAYLPNTSVSAELRAAGEPGLFAVSGRTSIYLVELDLEGHDPEPVRLRATLPVAPARREIGDLISNRRAATCLFFGRVV